MGKGNCNQRMFWKGGLCKETSELTFSDVRDMVGDFSLQTTEERRTVVDSEGRKETTVTHQEAGGSPRDGK